MSTLTDRLYSQWRRASGGSGVLITTGRPARPELLRKTKSQKAESRGVAASRPPVHNPMKEASNHGISQV